MQAAKKTAVHVPAELLDKARRSTGRGIETVPNLVLNWPAELERR